MVIMDVEEGVGQSSVRKGAPVLAVAQQRIDGGENIGLDVHALRMDKIAVPVDRPNALGLRIRRGNHNAAVRLRGNGPLVRRA